MHEPIDESQRFYGPLPYLLSPIVHGEYRTSLSANRSCWHALPLSVTATLTLAPGRSPCRPLGHRRRSGCRHRRWWQDRHPARKYRPLWADARSAAMAVGAVPEDRYERQIDHGRKLVGRVESIVHADERGRAGGHAANWTVAGGYEVSSRLMSTGQARAAVSADQVCRMYLPVLTAEHGIGLRTGSPWRGRPAGPGRRACWMTAWSRL